MGLIQVQKQLEASQIPTACIRGPLQDCFDKAAYLNFFGTSGQVWPIDIGELVEQGEKPLRTWIHTWPRLLDEKLRHEPLIKDGLPSPACHELASLDAPTLPTTE